MKYTRLLMGFVSVALLLGMSGAALAEDDNRAVHWLSYRAALNKAKTEDKPILLHFAASYESQSRKMKRETYQDPAVIRYLNENFAACWIDIEDVPSLGERYNVESFPTVWFLDADAKGLTSVNGEVGIKKMLRITEYISEKIYEHMNYGKWLDKQPRR